MDRQKVYRRRWIILGVLVISLIAIVLDNTVLNVALKTIAQPKGGLGASQSQLEWGINSYTLVFAGLLFTCLFSLLTAYSHSPDQLIFARAAMGLGAAAVMPQTLSIISNVFDPAERARAIGIWAVAVGIGVAIGPIVGGLLLAHFWWGSVFLINVPVTAIGVAAIALLVPESRNPDPGRIDFLGVLFSIAGLVLLVYGIIQGGDRGSWIHWDVLGVAAAGAAVLALFAWYEARLSHPSLDVKLFRDPRLSSAVGAITLVFFRGYSPLDAGLLTLPFAAGQMLVSPRTARLVRRFGAKAVGVGGLLTVTVALAGYQLLGTTTPIWVLGVIFFVQGAGMGGVMPSATEAVMSVVPRERAGSGSALTNTARQVGGALGVAVLGSIVAQVYRGQLSPHLAGLPAAARSTTTGSITATQAVASRLGSAGVSLDRFADVAFVHAMHVTTVASAAITLVGALVVLVWMPGRAAASSPAAPAEASGEAAAAIVPARTAARDTAGIGAAGTEAAEG